MLTKLTLYFLLPLRLWFFYFKYIRIGKPLNYSNMYALYNFVKDKKKKKKVAAAYSFNISNYLAIPLL